MPNRIWKSLEDVLYETRAILAELNKAASLIGGATDPIEMKKAVQRVKRLAANATTTNEHAINITVSRNLPTGESE